MKPPIIRELIDRSHGGAELPLQCSQNSSPNALILIDSRWREIQIDLEYGVSPLIASKEVKASNML